MKGLLYISSVFLISILILSFSYIWSNRIEIKNWRDGAFLIINKWTGKQCIFHPDFEVQSKSYGTLIELCEGELGRIIFP
tara:strand:- start:219 stop:458 length:240 start_codon:yes stop_codon:yes gene_type:complete